MDNKYIIAIHNVLKDEGFYELRDRYADDVCSAICTLIRDLSEMGWDTSMIEKDQEPF